MSDADLVAAACEQPPEFRHLYLRYAEPLYRYALGRTGSIADAEDIVSETMLAGLEHIDRFDSNRGTFSAWLFAIAKRKIADQHRRHGRLRRFLTRQPPSAVEAEDVLTVFVRFEDSARVWQAYRRLPDDYQEILSLRYGSGLAGRDIGEILKISHGAARMRLSRAIAQLRVELGDEYE